MLTMTLQFLQEFLEMQTEYGLLGSDWKAHCRSKVLLFKKNYTLNTSFFVQPN